MFERLRLAIPATLAALLAGALLTACGGSSPNPSAASNERSHETKLADFARCMREHGFDAEIATMPGGGQGLKIRPGKASGPEASEAAQKACSRYRPGQQTVNLSPQQKVEQEEAVQRFAACMRGHGIKVETSAKAGGIRITIQHHPGNGEPDPESPAFQQAQAACQKLLPHKG
jgi:hypothetical protein